MVVLTTRKRAERCNYWKNSDIIKHGLPVRSEEYSHSQSGCAGLYQRSKEEFANVSMYGRTIETRLQEMVQEDEGATIRIGELEHKLQLAEQMADRTTSLGNILS